MGKSITKQEQTSNRHNLNSVHPHFSMYEKTVRTKPKLFKPNTV